MKKQWIRRTSALLLPVFRCCSCAAVPMRAQDYGSGRRHLLATFTMERTRADVAVDDYRPWR